MRKMERATGGENIIVVRDLRQNAARATRGHRANSDALDGNTFLARQGSDMCPVWWRTSKTCARLEIEKQDHTLAARFYSMRRRSWQCAPPKTTTGRFHSKRGLDATVSEVEPVRDEGESGNRSCRCHHRKAGRSNVTSRLPKHNDGKQVGDVGSLIEKKGAEHEDVGLIVTCEALLGLRP